MSTHIDISAWTPWCSVCDWQYSDCRTEAEAVVRAEQHQCGAA